jgi:surface antigen
MVVNMAVTVLLVIVVVGTLLAVIPVGGGHTIFGSQTGGMSQVRSNSSNIGLIAQQAATATAVTQDGYDASSGQSYAGLPTAPASYTSTYNPFTYGQCTYWADYYYHYLTGHWVPWVGSALDWGYGAQRFGWVVSMQPKVYSIIVLQPGVQFAGVYGHVAVVTKINADGSVVTSNMNWTGQFGQVSQVTFWPGGSTRFVWYPGT